MSHDGRFHASAHAFRKKYSAYVGGVSTMLPVPMTLAAQSHVGSTTTMLSVGSAIDAIVTALMSDVTI